MQTDEALSPKGERVSYDGTGGDHNGGKTRTRTRLRVRADPSDGGAFQTADGVPLAQVRGQVPNSAVAARSGLHVFAADLEVEAVRVLHVEAVFGIRRRVQTPALQLCLDVRLVPVLDGVGDVIDARRLHTLAGVARQEKRVAKGEITLAPRVAGHLHAEQVD